MIRVEKLERETSIKGQKITFITHDIAEVDKLIAKYHDKPLQVKFEPIRHKRSLNANAYSWALTDRLADVMNISKDECHRLMLQRYGQTAEDKDGNKMIISALASIPEKALTEMLGYIAPIKTHGFVDGKEFIHYRVLKGSHDFDTKEMSHFLDGIISECKEVGIDTATPDEVERMKSLWRKSNE